MQNLLNKMSEYGLLCSDPILDSKIHRTGTIEKPNSKNGWYVGVLLNDKVYCDFGDWAAGQKIKYNNNGTSEISSDDMAILEMIRAKVEQEKQEKYKKAAIQAVKMIEKSEDILEYVYLSNKQIHAHIARSYKNFIIIPIYNFSGELVNLQRIYPDGSKKFLFGGEISGCAAAIQGTNPGKICICEGYATAASIAEATGYKVIISFNAGNLEKVSKLIREKNPNSEILICADNDKSGTGEKYGRKAAELIQAGFIMPEIVGYDFNDLHCQQGLQVVKDFICPQPDFTCSINDLSDSDNSIELCIPENMYKGHGLLEIGLKAALQAGAPDIIQYNLPVIFSLIARAIAPKLSLDGVYPSIYNIKVGGTSTGKTDSDKAFKNAVFQTGIENFYGPTDFSSGPGLLRGMQDGNMPQCFITMDEASFLFKRTKDDPVSAGKIAALLELYTCAGTEINRPYADSSKSILLKNPCLVLTGNATPGVFDEIQLEDLVSGTIQRFDFWTFDGKIPYRKRAQQDNPEMQIFVTGLINIMAAIAPMNNKHDISSLLMNYPLNLNDKAGKLLDNYSIEITDKLNEIKEDEGTRGIVSRRYDASKKYCMLFAAGTRPVENLFEPIEEKELEYGIAIAEMLSNWKIKTLGCKITSGEFHKNCEIFKDAIKSAMKATLKPSIKVLCNRKKHLKELKPKDLQDIISTLVSQDEIILDETGRKPNYWLKKEDL